MGDLPSLVRETVTADLALREFAAEALDVYLLDPSAGDFSGAVLETLSIAHEPLGALQPARARREVQAWIDRLERYLDVLHARLRGLPGG